MRLIQYRQTLMNRHELRAIPAVQSTDPLCFAVCKHGGTQYLPKVPHRIRKLGRIFQAETRALAAVQQATSHQTTKAQSLGDRAPVFPPTYFGPRQSHWPRLRLLLLILGLADARQR
jgi:hypothetical protein